MPDVFLMIHHIHRPGQNGNAEGRVSNNLETLIVNKLEHQWAEKLL